MTDGDPARSAWRIVSELVLSADRKVAVSKELGLSWVRCRPCAGRTPKTGGPSSSA